MCDAKTLRDARRAYLVAPAGCGKTYLIAEAVSAGSGGRELILTHTHAGVNALRERLRKFGAPANSYDVETIAGWACRIAAAFPRTSGFAAAVPLRNADWDLAYEACARFLRLSPARAIVQASYSGLYVDEYQDCTTVQHDLVLELAKLLPCRLLGDPLQGIFDFRNNKPVDWDRDVEPTFQKLPDHSHPWRWKGSSELGGWLAEIRNKLEGRAIIDLNHRPQSVRWAALPATGSGMSIQREECSRLARNTKHGERSVAIHDAVQAAACHRLGAILGGSYDMIEPIDCRDLYDAAAQIDAGQGAERIAAVLKFADKCLTRIGPDLKAFRQRLQADGALDIDSLRGTAYEGILSALAADGGFRAVEIALDAFQKIPGAKVTRREMLFEMHRALRESEGSGSTLTESVSTVRNRTSISGRPLRKLTIGRTVLIKGLEFDHALVLDADSLNTRSLYVALTRGSKSLTILSRSVELNPYLNDNASSLKPRSRTSRKSQKAKMLPLFPDIYET
jgi:DNA helicase-2/ATP-dependent DNA helicase PcrA